MKEFIKGKVVTGLVVLATIILAGVAIFTALRLYQLRQQSISLKSPESVPLAWDCLNYTFSVNGSGVVSVVNNQQRTEPSQQANVFINGTQVATLNVPTLAAGQSASIGNVQVPQGGFSWSVIGTVDCKNSGTQAVACQALTFTLSQNTPTLTPTGEPSSTPTSSPTPTQPPIGGTSSTPTPTLSVTPTPTLNPSATPTLTALASPTPTLPPPPSIPAPPTCTAQKPSSPTLTSVTRNGTSAKLTWTSVSLADHYVISYGTSPDNLPYGVPNTGNVTTYTIGSLDPNSKYYFTVYAVNDCMPSEGSKIVPSVAGTSATGELPATGIPFPTIAGVVGGLVLILIATILAF